MANNRENGLKGKLGLLSVIAIIIADMVGTGIFTTSGLVMENLRNPVLMVSLWGLVGLIALTGAFCYAELSTAMPYAGGEYLYLSRLFHPLAGFLSGWISFIVGFSAPVAAASVGMSEYFLGAFPGLETVQLFQTSLSPAVMQKGLAILVVVVFTLVHLQGVRMGAWVHNGLTIIKIAMIAGVIALGFAFGDGDWGHFAVDHSSVFSTSGFQSVGLSILWISFAYTGWNAAAYIGSEVKNPRRNLPRALIAGTGIVIVMYILLNVLFIYAIPPGAMEGVISIGTLAVNRLFGEGIGRVFSLLVAVSLFSSISALIILGPRIYYAMAKQGHFFKFASRIHPRTGVPHISVIIQGAVAVLIVLSGTFDQILTYMGFALGIFPIMAAFGVFVLRRKQLSSYRAPWHPVIPVFFIIMNVLMLIAGYSQRPAESSIAVATVLAGVPLYYLFKHKRKY